MKFNISFGSDAYKLHTMDKISGNSEFSYKFNDHTYNCTL